MNHKKLIVILSALCGTTAAFGMAILTHEGHLLGAVAVAAAVYMMIYAHRAWHSR